MFEMAVRQNVYEERQNQLRWQVKIGEEPVSAKARQQVLEAREDAWILYKVSQLVLFLRYFRCIFKHIWSKHNEVLKLTDVYLYISISQQRIIYQICFTRCHQVR